VTEVILQRLVLRTLIRKRSLSLSALVLDLLRLLGALVLDLLLASVLLHREPVPRYGEYNRNSKGAKKMQPVPDRLCAKLSKRPCLAMPLSFLGTFLLLRGVRLSLSLPSDS
jgi:hypothetical protein